MRGGKYRSALVPGDRHAVAVNKHTYIFLLTAPESLFLPGNTGSPPETAYFLRPVAELGVRQTVSKNTGACVYVGRGGLKRRRKRKKKKISAKKKKDKRGCRRENVKETSAFDERQLKKEREGEGDTLGGYC